MIQFATATKPAPLKSELLTRISYGLAAWTLVLAVTQMIGFEDFVDSLQNFQIGGYRTALGVAIALITLEVFSIPFLLRLWLSPAARFVSAACTMALPYVWTFVILSPIMNNVAAANAGLFSKFVTVSLPLGLALSLVWMVVVGLTFGAFGGRRAFKIPKKVSYKRRES